MLCIKGLPRQHTRHPLNTIPVMFESFAAAPVPFSAGGALGALAVVAIFVGRCGCTDNDRLKELCSPLALPHITCARPGKLR